MSIVERGMPVFVSEYVPETAPPPPELLRPVRDVPARRGGRRTDFGRHFVAGAWDRGTSKPAPMPGPGYFIVDGALHIHPKTWEKIQAGMKLAVEVRARRGYYMDGV